MFDVKHTRSFCGGRDNLLSSRGEFCLLRGWLGRLPLRCRFGGRLELCVRIFEVLSAMRRGLLLRLFCGAQTVCLAVACEYLGKLCVLGVVKRRRSRVCAVYAVCLSAQRSSQALYVLCRAMLESGRSFDRVSVSLHMLWRCYESKSAFVLCARMSIVCRRFRRAHLACLLCAFTCLSSRFLFLGCARVRRQWHARRITTVWACCVRFACEFGRRESFGMLFD